MNIANALLIDTIAYCHCLGRQMPMPWRLKYTQKIWTFFFLMDKNHSFSYH